MIDFEMAPDSSSFISSSENLPDFISQLNPPQREAALHTEGPLIVLAGAGSGKTKMLTSRIAYLMGVMGVPPYQILAVTFTNKAAAEMKERVQGAIGGRTYSQPDIGTFHSIALKILRKEMDRTPFSKAFVVYDDADQLALIKMVMDRLNIDKKAVNPKSIRGSINSAKCDAISPGELEVSNFNPYERQLKKIYEAYQKELYANNAVDFGEILCMAYRILRDHEDVRTRYQKLYRYIHVDEYQDTNRAQYLFLTMLAHRDFGGHQNICVVGDEDQSIYGWRGADIQNILNFEKDYPGAKLVKLEQNYRSTKTVVEAASHVIKNNGQRKEKTLWTDNEEGSSIVLYQVADEKMEAETVISEMKRIVASEGRSWDDFVIFYRTHAQSRQFEDVLRREKIDYQIVGGLRFYDRKEIKDIFAYFKLILNPSDSVSLKRIINVPARGIGKTTLDRLDETLYEETVQGSDGSFGDLWSLCVDVSEGNSRFTPRACSKIKGFVSILNKCMEAQPRLLLSELYHLILDETGYVQELKKEGTPEALARVENLEEFDTLLQEYEEEVLKGLNDEEVDSKKKDLLSAFLERSSLQTDVDTGFVPSVVRLMTLHGSKGLEFPVVFMVGMEEGLFPSVQPWEDTQEDDLEEERRLCYVGMTRAREKLYLLTAAVRRIWGKTSYQEPARFLNEIPGKYIDLRNLSPRPNRTQQDDYGRTTRFSSSSYDEYSQESDFQTADCIGQRVNHPDYGPGSIIKSEGMGNAQKVTIEFRGRVRRKFLMRFILDYLEIE